MPDLPAIVHVAWAPELSDLAGPLAVLLPARGETLALVPAPLERGNAPVSALCAAWREKGLPMTLLLPRAGISSVLPRKSGRWTPVDVGESPMRLDARITGRPYTTILVVTEDLRRGPFVLDLPPRFLHPVDRLRLAAHLGRMRLHADIAAAALPLSSILLVPVADGWLAVASADPVAAELWALALAERWLGDDIEVQGPWEDLSVQRATELGLGVRIPGDMVVQPIAGATLPAVACELLMESASRLGIPHLSIIG